MKIEAQKNSFLVVLVSLGLVAVVMGAQLLVQAVVQGFSHSKSIRVSESNTCNVGTGDTHFVGCSSIL